MTNVRLSVTRLNPEHITLPGTVLLDVLEDDVTVAERARAWAAVRGYDRLMPGLEQMFGDSPPDSGFAAVINKAHSLLVLATWPWCPTPHPIEAEPSGWPDS